MPQNQVDKTLDHLFRYQYGSIVAGLTARFGGASLEMIEDSVQESLLKAAKIWSYQGVPDKPDGWLYRVAYNTMIDELRKEERHNKLELENEGHTEISEFRDSRTIQDEQLKMIFACSNPKLKEKSSLMLSLKLLGGFSISEIARAFLMGDEAAKKSVQRARKEFKDTISELNIPAGKALQSYLNRVLKVIYLIFNEGYKASNGDQLIKEDLCGEALRLALLLNGKDYCQTSELYSLISMMCFKSARFAARLDENGELVLLEDQDRSIYSNEYLQWAYYYFSQATKFQERSTYYLEAAVEYEYNIARNFEDINWDKVLFLHQQLVDLSPSGLTKLNYFIVYYKVYGPVRCIEQIQKERFELEDNHLYHSFMASLYEELNHLASAREHLARALNLVSNDIERKHLEKKMAGIQPTIN